MKDIRGHKSRNASEIVDLLLRSGTYTCPTLPHYRYDAVKTACRKLKRLGLVKTAGRNPESVNLVVTDLFREWRQEHENGRTALGALRWAKAKAAASVSP